MACHSVTIRDTEFGNGGTCVSGVPAAASECAPGGQINGGGEVTFEQNALARSLGTRIG